MTGDGDVLGQAVSELDDAELLVLLREATRLRTSGRAVCYVGHPRPRIAAPLNVPSYEKW